MADDTSLDTDVPGLGDVPTGNGASTSATPWLKMIKDAEKAFHDYQERSDKIDKLYADLERLANTTRDREIQIFWANISVTGPSCYSRPPVPVVVPRFKQRDELPRTTSEMLERCTIVTFEQENVDGEMRLIRDDLVILARGAAWLRLATVGNVTRVCIDQADRKDWLCEPARKWKDVDWVAKRSWLTQNAAKKRFQKSSADAYKSLDYAVRKDGKSDSDDGSEKAGVWELWCRSANKVVWVSEGCEVCLDEGPPHLKLEDFFPCPRPAFATLQRRSLIPVPDILFYKDQLEEINDITARIAALTEALQVRGFYPSGVGDVSDAIEAALKSTAKNQVMVPIANLSGLSGQSLKDAIAWLPTDVISATITAIIAIRKELIQDVYEVTGLSDIMRGQSDPNETLGAQQLKTQTGSTRIKDKQDELVRLARDITRMTAEIIADNFDGKTLMEMSQMPLPSDAEIEKQAEPLTAELEKIGKELPTLTAHLSGLQKEVQDASQDPEVQQMAQANPDKAKQIMQAVQGQIQEMQGQVQQMQQEGPALQAQLKKLSETVTIDKVLKLLREQRLRPFILDIETDSTIAPDENASKQRATEFVTAVGGYLKNALPLLDSMPQAAPMVGETLKFIVAQFRGGRQLQGVIDKFADDMEAKAQQPPPPNPEQQKAQQEAAAQQQKAQQDQEAHQNKQAQDAEAHQADVATKQAQAQKDTAEANATAADTERLTLEAQTAAKDADIARKIKVQQELDASDARKQEMAQKGTLGAIAIAAARETHAQNMEKGALELEKLKTSIQHAAVTTASTLAKDDAAQAAHAASAAAAAQKPNKETK